jgi:hypothetical protein
MIDRDVYSGGRSGATKQGAKPFWSLRQISFVYVIKNDTHHFCPKRTPLPADSAPYRTLPAGSLNMNQ